VIPLDGTAVQFGGDLSAGTRLRERWTIWNALDADRWNAAPSGGHFDEDEIFELLLAHGADVNACAKVDAEAFGGHTPIFNAVVSHGRHQGSMARRLVERGASMTVRASLRKFLDWCETPRWHEAREVTPASGDEPFRKKAGERGSNAGGGEPLNGSRVEVQMFNLRRLSKGQRKDADFAGGRRGNGEGTEARIGRVSVKSERSQ